MQPFSNSISYFMQESPYRSKNQWEIYPFHQNQKTMFFLLRENYQIRKQLAQIHLLLNQKQNSLLPDHLPLKSDNVILQSLNFKTKRIYRKSEHLLKKDISCPEENCKRKYSSRIALNSHLRKRHNKHKQSRNEYNNIQEENSQRFSIQQTKK